jgi:hypothetical protein
VNTSRRPLKIKLGVSYNIIDGSMPDRVQNILEMKIQVTNYQASQLLITIDTFKKKTN